MDITSRTYPSLTSSGVRVVSRIVNTLFSIPTTKPSFAEILTSRKSSVISYSFPPSSSFTGPAETSAMSSFASSFASFPANSFISLPRTGPAALKSGFTAKFIYLSRSFSNTTFLTLSSSVIRGTRSPIRSSYLPSTITSLRGCLTLSLSFSLVPLPRLTRVFTSPILSSVFSSIRLPFEVGK